MAAVENVQNATSATTSLTITKPTGLAVGDLLVACVSSGGVNATPTGWTMRTSTVNWFSFITKVADSSDVAASNFTFTSTGGPMIGSLYRISNATTTGITAVQESGFTMSGVGGSDTVTTSCSFTPYVSGAILIHAGAAYDTDNDVVTYGSRAITGGASPSWTERYEASSTSGSNTASLSIADATYASATEITDFTAVGTIANGDVNGEPHAMLFINPKNDATGTTTLLQGAPTFFTPAGSAGTSGTATLLEATPTVNTASGSADNFKWTNESGTTTTWTNET